MKATKTLFHLPEKVRAIIFILAIILISFYGQAIKAGNHDPKVNEKVETSPMTDLTLQLTPYVYPNGFNVSCNGFTDGSIDLTVTGGVPPYKYDWSNKEITQDISNLSIGYYKVVVTDAAQQVLSAEITLFGPDPKMEPTITEVISSYPNGYNISCYQCFNGSIDLTVTGGTGVYTYQWDKNGPTTQDRYGLGKGTYGVTINDASACGNNQRFFRSYEITEPPREDIWEMYGNSYSNPPDQFIGTTDNKDLVFKTNNIENLRINGNGNVGIGTNNPTERLTVGGNMLVDGKITANRISSPDSLLYLGDSSVVINWSGYQIYTENGPSVYKGLGIGSSARGIGAHSFAVGYRARANSARSFAFGSFVTALEPNSFIIGSGPQNQPLLNDVENSLMIGFNSTEPTFYVGPSNGGVTTGNVGIGTKDPEGFKVKIDAGTYGGLLLKTTHNYDWGYALKIDVDMSTTKALIIEQSGTANFLVYGDGKVWAREITVKLGGLGDFVFAHDYKLLPIDELEKYVKLNSHLPGIPSAAEVNNDGLNVGEFQNKLLQKIEELTLYVIELNKKNDELQKEIFDLKNDK